MNAPKGMGLSKDTLYVTDIDRLHAVDVQTGKIQFTVDVPGAKFLNDIGIAADGKVYVSDMVTGKIHVLEDKKLPEFVDLKSFKGSNVFFRIPDLVCRRLQVLASGGGGAAT